jgi:hypothetical protein
VTALGMTTVASAHATTLRGAELEEAFRSSADRPGGHRPPAGQAELDAILAVDQLQVA